MKVQARVYTKDGNRFLIPGHWYSDDDPTLGLGSAANAIIEGMTWAVTCGFDVSKDWIEIETDASGHGAIEHYRCDMIGRQFAHGAVTVWVIGGPLFDEAKAKEQKPNG